MPETVDDLLGPEPKVDDLLGPEQAPKPPVNYQLNPPTTAPMAMAGAVNKDVSCPTGSALYEIASAAHRGRGGILRGLGEFTDPPDEGTNRGAMMQKYNPLLKAIQ